MCNAIRVRMGQLLADRRGLSQLEYALIGSISAVVVTGAYSAMATKLAAIADAIFP
jgi:Flp pilus assembly pilin Flp